MEPSEESITALVNMGFGNLEEVRRALKLSRDDVNEAVAILTSEHTTTSFDTLDDIEMKDMNDRSSNIHYGPDPPPPSYDEAVEPIEDEEISSVNDEHKDDNDSVEFPTTHLYELEGRVFTDQWSIPYKRDESLGKCLVAATRLANEGKLEQDENCVRFVERCMPEAFRKLMTSSAVQRWGADIQEGIYTMLQLLVDLIAARLQYRPVPMVLLQSLLLAFNLDTEFHCKNRMKKADKLHYEEIFGINQTYAVSPPYNTYKDPCGWLVNLINKFAEKGGIDHIKLCIVEPSEEADACSMTALLQPLSACAEYLNPLRVTTFLLPVKATVKKYVEDVTDSELKHKKASSICDLLSTLKIFCINFWSEDVRDVDNLRLTIALRMLKSPHFNAKMNSLKEIRKMIEESTASRPGRKAIDEDVIADWLVENRILTVALEGNIDQSQYCDRLKGIVEFLGTKLSLEELTKIWKMQQNDQHMTVVDNIHSIMAAAAVHLNSAQLDHLFRLIQKAWSEESDRMREKLLSLIGTIGRESKNAKTTNKVLELLWDLAHIPAIPNSHLEHALKEHLTILSESYSITMQVKNKYITKCVEDVKRGSLVVPAMRQLHLIAKGINNKYDKSIPHELHKNHDIIKLITHSLMKSHRGSSVSASNGIPVTPGLYVDGRYTHAEHVQVHLDFLAFILEVGVLYLHWHRAREIWECLVANTEAIEYDKEMCFDWFKSGLNDLEADTQQQLFTQKLLKLDPGSLSPKNFGCVKAYFDSVNLNNHALKKSGPNLVVEKLDLLGLEFMWQVALENPNEEIANAAIKHLMKMYYTGLTMKLKKDTVSLHKRFIAECYKRLEEATVTLGGSAVAFAISKANKALTAATLPEVALLPSPSRCVRLLTIERLLQLAETYVTIVEDQHTCTRIILPHAASYQGHPITMHIICDIPKYDFTIVGNSNESLRSVRTKIALRMKTNTDNVQIAANDTVMLSCKDQKLLHQLSFEEEQSLTVKQTMVSSIQYSSRCDENIPSFQPRTAYAMELERSLPGVVMATGGQVFEMLYQLADLDEPKITKRVRNLLRLIPTDPSIIEALDNICHYNEDVDSYDDKSPVKSPKQVLQDLFTTSSTSSMSPFRVLYNLEVLSACLMPANQEDSALQASTRRFRECFLNAGGLNLIVSILQKDSIPSDADEETRRGCYSICIQLARFVLCGQTTTALMENDLSLSTSQQEATLDSSCFSSSSVGSSPRKSGLWNRMSSIETAGGDFSGKEGTAVAISVIQTMSPAEYTSMISQLMRVTWAAAAGRLYLASTNQPIKEHHAPTFNMGRRSRQSSTGSTASSSSDSDVQSLQSGVCMLKSKVSNGDAMIARDALELLVACLQLRSQLLNSFYNLPSVSDFIIEILLASAHHEVRIAAMEQFYTLAMTYIQDSPHLLQPKHFLIQVLIKAHVPLWITSTYTRASNLRLLNQCKQYFDLRCHLFERLLVEEQKLLSINLHSMLQTEIEWLGNFELGTCEESATEIENLLITGHLLMMKSLLTCQNVDKKQIGKQLIYNMLNEYLYPASRLILANASNTNINHHLNLNPKLSYTDAKSAAYDLLVTLCEDCSENLSQVAQHLSMMHHQPSPSLQLQWDFSPPVDGRSPSKYVGLKNGGATCYMNSVIQQLYMVPGIREEILGCHDNDENEETVFYQLQMIFGHLMESKLQYYEPERFWRVFKLWGEPVNVREQQDAFEFFTDLTDQIDEHLKANGKKQVFKSKFQGVFTDQKICQDCPHRYEREEEFFALNLTVKSQNLEASLEQFVRGEMLEGDNAYFCEKCNEKRNTIKRTCIKTLPPVLVIHLKRFGYDWEAGRALKFDDYFKFPWVLDMEPYTAEGMSRRESITDQQECDIAIEMKNKGTHSKLNEQYQLVGVLVHSGQANAGHYYSFIRDRWGTSMNNTSKGKWFKFNDIVVEEFDMTDMAVEAECFGGSYKPKMYDHGNSYSETRLRYWSGYMLFYEKIEGTKTPESTIQRLLIPRATLLKQDSEGDIQIVSCSPDMSPVHSSDELNELSALVQKGERRGIFMDKMPPTVQRFILDDNLQYMRNRDIFNTEYFSFIRSLVSCNSSHIFLKDYETMAVTSMQLIMSFLLNTYFRTKKSFRSDQDDWEHCVEVLIRNSHDGREWLIRYLNSDIGRPYIKQYLLECPSTEVRVSFARIMENALCYLISHKSSVSVSSIPDLDGLLEHLLSLLDNTVASHCRKCSQYFGLLNTYLNISVSCCVHLFERGAFRRLVTFLVGPLSDNQDSETRRWASAHTRDFACLHTLIADMVVHCDVSQFRTVDPNPDDKPPFRPPIPGLDTLLSTPDDIKEIMLGQVGRKYTREAVAGCRELPHGTSAPVVCMLLQLCYCNETFTRDILDAIQNQIVTAPAHDLKSICSLLLELLQMKDPLQSMRLKLCVEGQDSDGLLAIIQGCNVTDSRRSYQCIKFLVNLSNKCPVAKDYLVSIMAKWQWAIIWLKKKMNEHSWTPQHTSNESSSGKTFQRTISAQDTLAEATALFEQLSTDEDEEKKDEDEKETNQEKETEEMDTSQSSLSLDDTGNSDNFTNSRNEESSLSLDEIDT